MGNDRAKTVCPNCLKTFTYPVIRGGSIANCPACKVPLNLPKVESAIPVYESQGLIPPPFPEQKPVPQTIVAQPQPVIVNVTAPQQSNTTPLLLNLFLLPGTGQMFCQDRVWWGLFLFLSWVASFPLMCLGIGFVTAPIIYVVAAIDVASWKGC